MLWPRKKKTVGHTNPVHRFKLTGDDTFLKPRGETRHINMMFLKRATGTKLCCDSPGSLSQLFSRTLYSLCVFTLQTSCTPPPLPPPNWLFRCEHMLTSKQTHTHTLSDSAVCVCVKVNLFPLHLFSNYSDV